MTEENPLDDLNYCVIPEHKIGVTKVVIFVPGLKTQILSSGKGLKETKNAKVDIKITEKGDMGKITIFPSKTSSVTHRILIDGEDVGYKWAREPLSFYKVKDEMICFYLKRK